MTEIRHSSKDLQKLLKESDWQSDYDKASTFEEEMCKSASNVLAIYNSTEYEYIPKWIVNNEVYQEAIVFLALAFLRYELMPLKLDSLKKISPLKSFVESIVDDDALCLKLLQKLSYLEGVKERMLGLLACNYSSKHFLTVILSLGLRLDTINLEILKTEKFKKSILKYACDHRILQRKEKKISAFLKHHATLIKIYNDFKKYEFKERPRLEALKQELIARKKTIGKKKAQICKEIKWNKKWGFATSDRSKRSMDEVSLDELKLNFWFAACLTEAERKEKENNKRKKYLSSQHVFIDKYSDILKKKEELDQDKNNLLNHKKALVQEIQENIHHPREKRHLGKEKYKFFQFNKKTLNDVNENDQQNQKYSSAFLTELKDRSTIDDGIVLSNYFNA